MRLTRIALILLLSILLVPYVACSSATPTHTTVPTPTPTPDAGLLAFQQSKMTQLNLLNTELADLQPKIDEKMAELLNQQNVFNQAMARLESMGISTYPGFNMNLLTQEEIMAYFNISIIEREVYAFKANQTQLMSNKEYVEQDIEEIKQFSALTEYHAFKTSQLDNLTSQLVVLRVDIDQKIAGAQQNYDLLLTQRGFVMQDIQEIKQLLGDS